MDINLMVLNVGNSRLAIGVFSEGKLEFVTRTPHENRADWPGRIADAWARISNLEEPVVVGASVNPPLLESVEHAVERATGKPVLWVGRDIDLPIEVQTENPKETGVDRVLNVAAAYEQIGRAVAVVDAGTAITVDCCDDAGNFQGGAIFPGTSLLLDSLHDKTAKLPRVPLAVPHPGAFGKNTQQAILHGVYSGVRGMVKELVENYATQLGNWPELIATGGDAEVLFKGWELVHAIAPDLTLYGIAHAYTEHQIRNAE